MKFGTMNKVKLFIKCMSTKMKDFTFKLSADHLLFLSYEEFNVFRQADMMSMGSNPKSSPPCPTTPMTSLTSHTPGSKKRQAFSPQHDDLLHEPCFLSLKKPYLTKMILILPHLHLFNLLSILLNLKKLPSFCS